MRRPKEANFMLGICILGSCMDGMWTSASHSGVLRRCKARRSLFRCTESSVASSLLMPSWSMITLALNARPPPFIHSVTHSLSQSVTHSFIHSLIHSLTYVYIPSPIHSFVCMFIHSFSLICIHPCNQSFLHPSIHALIHSPNMCLLTSAGTCSFQ